MSKRSYSRFDLSRDSRGKRQRTEDGNREKGRRNRRSGTDDSRRSFPDKHRNNRGGGRGGRGRGGRGDGGFWKPGTVAPGSSVTREGGAYFVPNTRGALSLTQQRQLLPICKHRSEILYALEKYRVVIIVGETGSGKTTQIPQFLHESGWTAGGRMVACTQPRRVAATEVARRVASEMGTTLGEEVGYSIRFDQCYDGSRTKIKYLTDGMLLREMMSDPLLSSYSVIMLDEAHERTIHTDALIGLLKKILRKRSDLRIIVSSATLNAEDFKSFFEAGTDSGEAGTDSGKAG
eukprot:101693_1